MSPYRQLIKSIQRIFKPTGERISPHTALHIPDCEEHPPVIIPRAEHTVSRKDISKNALKVLYKLKDAGYQGYIVGGGVRDILLDLHPKDFDIATNAKPEEVKSLFRNCRLIGRRFRLAHVHFGREIIEVATFRAHHSGGADDNTHSRIEENGLIIRDNVYGSFEEDAARRDFTVNALYYTIADFSVVDFHAGMADLEARLIRLIGDPLQRYREDPVRMLRAARFAAKLSFSIEESSARPIQDLANLLKDIPGSRLYDETQKLFLGGYGLRSFQELRRYGLFKILFPTAAEHLDENGTRLLESVLKSSDERVAQGKPVTPAFFFAALLWVPCQKLTARYQEKQEMSWNDALHEAGYQVFRGKNDCVTVPKRVALIVRDIWHLQHRMQRYKGKRALRLLSHQAFRAAYDFFALRAEIETDLKSDFKRWQALHQEREGGQPPRSEQETSEKPPRSRPRRRRRGPRGGAKKTDAG